MSEGPQAHGFRPAMLVATLVLAGSGIVVAALVAGLLALVGAIPAHGQLRHLAPRPFPLSTGFLLGLVYGLIPVLSLGAVALGLVQGSHRRRAASDGVQRPPGP